MAHIRRDFLKKSIILLIIGLIIYKFGIDVILSYDFGRDKNWNQKWTIGKLNNDIDIYDVVVIGGEPEGVAAAASSARVGARTLLISEYKSIDEPIAKVMRSDMEISIGQEGEMLNRGFIDELSDELKGNFSAKNYSKAVNRLFKKYNNLSYIQDTVVVKPTIDNNKITSVIINGPDGQKLIKGSRFIDATPDGNLLEMCGVPFFKGSEDINMKNCFLPLKLNFEIDGVDIKAAPKSISNNNTEISMAVSAYIPIHSNIRVNRLNIFPQDGKKAILQGVEVSGIDIYNSHMTQRAYKEASEEIYRLLEFIKNRVAYLKNCTIVKVADSFLIDERRHFAGEYVLNIEDVLENRNFQDKIAIGSFEVDVAKLLNGRSCVVGKPTQFTVPIGCIIPQKIDNLIMVGPKASYASVIASSVSPMGLSLNVAHSAGITAAYTIVADITPREILKKDYQKRIGDLTVILKRNSVFLPDFTYKNPNLENWSYPSLKKLLSLGLVAGGFQNDYKFSKEAVQEDMALLLLNGIYRNSPEKYSLSIDSTLKKFFSKEKLTKEVLGKMLLSLYQRRSVPQDAYNEAYNIGLIDEFFKIRLEEKEVLTLDDVYYISSRTIESIADLK